MKEIQSLLKIVSDGLKIIAKGVEVISEKVDEIAKSQTGTQSRVKRRRPTTPRKKTARKTTAKAEKKRTAKAPTAAETAHQIISESEEGVDMATLMKKTGYDSKKIANLIYKLGKQGKIKSIRKGVYVKA